MNGVHISAVTHHSIPSLCFCFAALWGFFPYQLVYASPGSRSSDISESIVTPLAGLQTLQAHSFLLSRRGFEGTDRSNNTWTGNGLEKKNTWTVPKMKQLLRVNYMLSLFYDTIHNDSFKYEDAMPRTKRGCRVISL